VGGSLSDALSEVDKAVHDHWRVGTAPRVSGPTAPCRTIGAFARKPTVPATRASSTTST